MFPESASCWISRAFCVHHIFSILTCDWTAAFALEWTSLLSLQLIVILPGDESFPLGVDKPLDFCIALIKPVLMFPRFVTKDSFAGVVPMRVPMLYNILWILVWQVCAEGCLQLLLEGGFSQSLDVKPWAGLSFLLPSYPHQTDRHDGANEPVVRPAFISTDHCSRAERIMAVNERLERGCIQDVLNLVF